MATMPPTIQHTADGASSRASAKLIRQGYDHSVEEVVNTAETGVRN
jgi:hypothetical protein